MLYCYDRPPLRADDGDRDGPQQGRLGGHAPCPFERSLVDAIGIARDGRMCVGERGRDLRRRRVIQRDHVGLRANSR